MPEVFNQIAESIANDAPSAALRIATITEIEQFITRQVQVLVVTEAEGYAIIEKNAINILNVNA